MIRKLRLKFVVICMLSLLVVLSVIIVGMNIVTYQNMVRQADELLELLEDNEACFPAFSGPGGKLPPHLSPEVPYETRFFSVTLDTGTGKIIHINTGRIAAVNSSEAADFAARAEGEQGFVEDFRFLRCQDGDNERLIFLDCGRRIDSWRGFLLTSVLISLLGYVVVFVLVLFFSGWVARPFAENYEKQKRFITDAGHELKTPLTIIRADADVLEMELGSNEWLEDIQKQAKRLSALTQDLVLLSRMEEENALSFSDFSLSDTVSQIAHSFLAPAQTREKSLELAITPGLNMKGNEQAIGQLTSILLDNAVKYAPVQTPICLTLEKQGRHTVLSVFNHTETHMGKEQLSRLFDRFYRGDDSRSSQGHGIGLSVARAIVNAHGGKLTATAPTPNTLLIAAQLPSNSQ